MSAPRRGGLLVALVTVLILGSGAFAHAGDYGGKEDGKGDVIVDGTETTETTTGGIGGTRIFVPGPWTQRVLVPYCPANLVRATGRGMREYEMDDDMCMGAVSTCPDPEDRRWWVFERPMNADNVATEDGFSRGGVVCRGAADPSEAEPPTITVEQIMDQARARAPRPTFVIEPAAKSYVNVPTNFAAQVAPATVNVELLGFTIPVEFTPGDATWRFGDGGSDTGVGVRNASVGQSGAVEHVYARSGDYDVSVTVGYDVRIIVPTGDPITLPTPISRAAAPQSLTVGEVQSVVTGVD
ncbi:hypothetical protein AFL01nite_30210 [Aeromicrobium flavum]|uniref:PKD domain-containing protein n=1 Tax=Aeromicrobium flavum TaxID=416568 RepID=A0A512HZ31_9ACTN|nr:PKD domain-containing protein [Aeromicrobium flavum]GEO90694.1 hypothetical protein AFL01nite_30210 [Aeromicrobium flavum]